MMSVKKPKVLKNQKSVSKERKSNFDHRQSAGRLKKNKPANSVISELDAALSNISDLGGQEF